nr:vinorine synthase-like [Ipomoea batatas]
MKVEVRSKEIVRPSSPTPQSLKNYKLSFMDQLALNVKLPFVFFYDSSVAYSHDRHTNTIDELKKSLSKTLSLMYPLAGRVKEDKVTIECNDEGVEFIVADVDENMCYLLDNPEMEKIKQMIIPTGTVYEPRPVGKALLAVQVNRFSCGGIAIGFFVSHAIADGSAVATLFETWASINRGYDVNGNGFVSDQSTVLFPPLADTSAIERSVKMAAEAIRQEEKNMVVKRFVIPAHAIAQLRDELIGKQQGVPSAPVSHRGDNGVSLGGRDKRNSSNSNRAVILHGERAEQDGAAAAAQLSRRIRDSLRSVNDAAARKMYGEEGLLRAAFARGHEMVRNKGSSTTLYTSSLCRQPYYEVDFGWGKPRLVVNLLKNSTVLFLDTIGGAVEVWMGLPKEVMHTLMQNRHFLTYVSASPKPKL